MQKKEPNYERYLIIGLVITLFILTGFSIYWVGETNRLIRAAESLSAERVEQGEKIYEENCASCHGDVGEGGSGPALNDKDLLQNTLDEIFFSVTRSGVPGTQMPAWSVDFGGPLTDEDIRNTVAFIRAWEPTAPKIEPVTFEPDPSRGALLYATTCEVCHGENGQGSTDAPALNNLEQLNKMDDDWYLATIRNGRPARGMPTWETVLSPHQLKDLIALIKSWREGAEVQDAFSVTDLIASAIFSLGENDPRSAALHVSRALTVADGKGAEMLRNTAAQLEQGDDAGALETLNTLQEQWPLGDAELGAPLYADYCGACHGNQGEGGLGSALQANQFIKDNTNAALVEFIWEGRSGTAMPGFDGRLTEREIADIIAFLRTWQP